MPASTDTVFGAASNTKAITAVAVLKLWSDGRLDLDAPIQRYVPAFPERKEGAITLRLLATHRSGLPQSRLRFSICHVPFSIRLQLPSHPPPPIGLFQP